jgi:hypothetical protein
MKLPSTYTLDKETIKLNSYRLLCLFYANIEIARLSDPEDRSDPASQLQSTFFSREMTQLLLSIAIGVRVLDDQMNNLAKTDPMRQSYFLTRDEVNARHRHIMWVDTMSLRDVCNKVIHATLVEPHTVNTRGSHKVDEDNYRGWCTADDLAPGEVGPEPEPIEWQYLSTNIRLGGIYAKKQWWHLLSLPTFVEAVFELLQATRQ